MQSLWSNSSRQRNNEHSLKNQTFGFNNWQNYSKAHQTQETYSLFFSQLIIVRYLWYITRAETMVTGIVCTQCYHKIDVKEWFALTAIIRCWCEHILSKRIHIQSSSSFSIFVTLISTIIVSLHCFAFFFLLLLMLPHLNHSNFTIYQLLSRLPIVLVFLKNI